MSAKRRTVQLRLPRCAQIATARERAYHRHRQRLHRRRRRRRRRLALTSPHRCSQTFPVDLELGGGTAELGAALLGARRVRDAVSPEATESATPTTRTGSFDPSRYRFVVSPTERTPGMIVSADAPIGE